MCSGPEVHFDVASAAGPQLDCILSALCPHYSRSLSAPFPRYLHTAAAVLPHCSSGISALLPQSFRCPCFSQDLQYSYVQAGSFEKTVAERPE